MELDGVELRCQFIDRRDAKVRGCTRTCDPVFSGGGRGKLWLLSVFETAFLKRGLEVSNK